MENHSLHFQKGILKHEKDVTVKSALERKLEPLVREVLEEYFKKKSELDEESFQKQLEESKK